jgi:FAD/FMN-containing dehydrogenase
VDERDCLQKLIEIVGGANALSDPTVQSPYLSEPRGLYHTKASAVLRPGSVEEVAKILAIANQGGIGIVPQGGNTGLVGGQVPSEDGTQVVLSLTRLNNLRSIERHALTVEAGVTLASVRVAAECAGRYFPLSLPSESSCQIGGVLATNAGGARVLEYGNARSLTLGLEVVTANGEIWNGLRTLKKDNTGYDLRDLFVGSEGTLGVITAAALKLYPPPSDTITAFVALSSLEDVAALFSSTEKHRPTAFEFMSGFALDLVIRHVSKTHLPMEPAPWFALIELPNMDAAQAALGDRRAVIASTASQAKALWRLRENISEAQRPEGGSIKHDVSVPVARIPEFIAAAGAAVERVCHGARPVVFGHFGDGNVHYNVTQPQGMDKADYLALWNDMASAVHDVVASFSGSISAEHGIGQMKRSELVRFKSPVEIAMMRKIKAALDPNGILNPGKVL